MLQTYLDNKYFIAGTSAVLSAVGTILVNNFLSRRGRFRYFVFHNRVGITTNDSVFGPVQVTWNNNVIQHLWLSTIDLVNESMRDFENVIVRAHSADTLLLTDRAEVVGTTHILNWTDEYTRQAAVPSGQKPTQQQFDLWSGQRDYLIPTMNRGQVIRFTYLNSARSENQPTIWLDVLHKGIKLEFRVAPPLVLGVSQPTAVLVGTSIGFFIIAVIVIYVQSVWVASIVSFGYGLFVLIPGAYAIKTWRRLRDSIGG